MSAQVAYSAELDDSILTRGLPIFVIAPLVFTTFMLGMAVHKVRARGSYIHSKSGSANGLVPMLRVFNATARLCDQVPKP